MNSHNVISIALLDSTIDIGALKELVGQVKKHFAYFEILLLNPIFSHKEGVICPSPQSNTEKIALESAESITQIIPNLRILHIATPLDSSLNLSSLQYEIFLQNCIGDYVLFMDLERDPLDSTLAMLTQASSYDICFGVRLHKGQNILQKCASKAFYKALAFLSDNEVKENYSEFCVLSRKVIHYLLHTQSDIKLLRLARFDSSFKILELPYIPNTPHKTKTKAFLPELHLGIEILIHSGFRLLRLGTISCLLFAFFNIFYALYIIVSYFLIPHITQGWTSTSLYMVLSNSGLFFMLCLIGEYLRMVLLRQKGKIVYDITDEESSVVLDFRQKNITTAQVADSRINLHKEI